MCAKIAPPSRTDSIDIALDPITIAFLLLAAFAAGFLDALAGGGGLITLPALLAAGLPPVNALATNKLQAVFGVATSSATVVRKGTIAISDIRTMAVYSRSEEHTSELQSH